MRTIDDGAGWAPCSIEQLHLAHFHRADYLARDPQLAPAEQRLSPEAYEMTRTFVLNEVQHLVNNVGRRMSSRVERAPRAYRSLARQHSRSCGPEGTRRYIFNPYDPYECFEHHAAVLAWMAAVDDADPGDADLGEVGQWVHPSDVDGGKFISEEDDAAGEETTDWIGVHMTPDECEHQAE